MKEGLISALAGDFITRRDFMPLKDENGNILTGGFVSTLMKQSFGSLVVLELIDADRVSLEDVSSILEGNAKRLEGINTPQCYIFETFIFDGEPDEEKLRVINEGQLHKAMTKKYVKCMSVSLAAKTVTKHFNTPLTDFSISSTINMRLREDSSYDHDAVQLEEIVRKREEERRIQFRAKTPFLTYALIAINIIVFGLIKLYSMRSGNGYDQLLSYFGAKVNMSILGGEYWRFITPMFLHANEVHLLINCYSLYAVGVTVEKVFGHTRFLIIYFFAGILGNIFSFMFSVNDAVGASGAIFGLMGALLYFGLERPALFKAYFGYSVITTIVINLGYGFSRSGIDNFAHMGGLLGGFLASGAVNVTAVRKWYLNRALYLLLILVITAGGLYYGFNNGNNLTLGKYGQIQTLMNENKYSEAEKLVEGLINAKPTNGDIRSSLLKVVLFAEAASGKPEEALQHALELIKVDPPSGHYFAGRVYYDLGKYDDSKRELLKAKELKADFSDIDQLLSDLESRVSV